MRSDERVSLYKGRLRLRTLGRSDAWHDVGDVIAVDDPTDSVYRIYDIDRLSARRGDKLGDDVILDAERALTRCLTADEVAELGLLPKAVYKEQPRAARASGRHACRSTLEWAAEPESGWDFWRSLMRHLMTAFPSSEVAVADPAPRH